MKRTPAELRLGDEVGTVVDAVSARCAILEQLGRAGQYFEAPGVNVELDEDLWRGIEDLMRQNRSDLKQLRQLASGDGEGE